MNKQNTLVAVFFAAIVFLIFLPQFISGKLMMWLDMLFYFMPFRVLTSEVIRQGIVPLWNPYIYCGNPLLADMQSAVLYPLNIFFYIFPFALAAKIMTFIAYFIAAVFMYNFSRIKRLSREAAFLSASLYAFSFYFVERAPEFADLHVMVWLPAILYFTVKRARTGKIFDLVFTGIALSMSFLGGHPQVFLYVFIIYAAVHFFEFYTLKKKFTVALADFAAAGTVLILITAIQWASTIEFIMNSSRQTGGRGFGYATTMNSYAGPEQILLFVMPFLEGIFQKSVSFLNWMGMIDVGIVGAVLFFAGAIKTQDKRQRNFFMVLFTVCFFAAFLGSMPFYHFLYNVFPVLRMIRYGTKINIVCFFVICLYAGIGYDLLFSKTAVSMKKAAALTGAAAFILVAAYAAATIFESRILLWYKNAFEPFIKPADYYIGVYKYRAMLSGLLTYNIYLMVCAGIFYLAANREMRPGMLKGILLFAAVFCAFSSHINNVDFDYMQPGALSVQPKSVKFLKSDPDMNSKRVLATFVANKFQYDLFAGKSQDVVDYNRECMVPNVPMQEGVFNADGFDSLSLGNFSMVKESLNNLKEPWDNRLFSLLSVKYVASNSKLSGKNIKPVYKSYIWLYEDNAAMNMAFFVPSSAEAYFMENNAALDRMLRDGFSPLKEIYFDSGSKGELGAAFGKNTEIPYGVNTADFKMINTNEYEVSVKNYSSGALVITDNYYPGWEAFVDGKKARIHRVFVTFKAVMLDPGEHKVIFKFIPRLFYYTAALSIIFIVLFLLACIVHLMRRKERNK
jgi:hypothetical protein